MKYSKKILAITSMITGGAIVCGGAFSATYFAFKKERSNNNNNDQGTHHQDSLAKYFGKDYYERTNIKSEDILKFAKEEMGKTDSKTISLNHYDQMIKSMETLTSKSLIFTFPISYSDSSRNNFFASLKHDRVTNSLFEGILVNGQNANDNLINGIIALKEIVTEDNNSFLDIFDTDNEIAKAFYMLLNKYRSIEYGKNNLNFLSAQKVMKSNLTNEIRRYFADMIINYSSKHNISDPLNEGKYHFIKNESNISVSNLEKEFTIHRGSNEVLTSTGLLMKSGETIEIEPSEDIYIQFGTVPVGVIHYEDFNVGYNREIKNDDIRFLIKKNHKYKFSSPVSRLLYIGPKDEEKLSVKIKFKNIANGIFLNSLDDSSLTKFIDEINNREEINFIDVSLPEFELHITKQKLIKSFNDYSNGLNLQSIKKYFQNQIASFNDTYKVAAFFGPNEDLTLDNDVVDFINTFMPFEQFKNNQKDFFGLFSHYDKTGYRRQHYYVDETEFGYMLAGNKICSAADSFNTSNWGEAHELGHTLQRPILNIYGSCGEASNNIFSWGTTRRAALRGNGYYYSHVGFNKIFEKLNDEFKANGLNSKMGLDNFIWNDPNGNFHKLGIFYQIMFASGDYNFYTKYLSVIDTLNYLIHKNGKNDPTFVSVLNHFNLGEYKDDFTSIHPRDILAIVGSTIMHKDLRNLFRGFRIQISNKAEGIINKLNLPATTAGLYKVHHYHNTGGDNFVIGTPSTPSGDDAIYLKADDMPSETDFIPFGNTAKWGAP